MEKNQDTDLLLNNYILKQKKLIQREYQLETKEKQKTIITDIDLYFILRSKSSLKKTKIWTTTLPLPKNLIPPEYLIIQDPTYVNISDKMRITFSDKSKSFIEGEVIKIRDGELTALFKLNWKGESARYKKCSIQFLPNDVVYKRKLDALPKLRILNNTLKNMLCRRYPKKQAILDIKLNIPEKNYKFNDSQKRAVLMSVSNPFSLIQGPPGTGKTHTIGAIAIQALKLEPNKKVLICGTTNVSINSLLEIVGDMVQSSGFKVCWPASSYRDFKTEDNITKEQKLMTLYISRHMNSNESRRFKYLCDKRNRNDHEDAEMNKLREKLEQKIIQQSNVIFSTLDSSGKKSIVQNIGKISTLIVDEATLSVESSMIIPLSLLPDRFVLVGDHKQLGPTPTFNELIKDGYYYSMFERIINEKSNIKNSVLLNIQYRMHPDISFLPNKLFYDNELVDGVKPEERTICKNVAFQKHFIFINVNGTEEKNGTSYLNMEEIDNVVKFTKSLIDNGVQSSQIGVISAYGAQTHLISERFKSDCIHAKISTIDSFQGSQKDYIIICTTRTGSGLGFLSDNRRMNVAITRARCMVVIFGNEDTLSSSPAWNEVIKYAKYKGSYITKLSIKIEKPKFEPLMISKNANNSTQEMVSEFKENEHDAGYNLHEICSEISNNKVRVLWPDEKEDIRYLKEWVQIRVNKLNRKNKNITLAYDAESVCMQFGDIFDENVDYYNWDPTIEIPEIKTNECIIISFYQHTNPYLLNPILINIMKPLLEHPRITLITFDFTFDFDKLDNFDINIQTKKIIDVQLMNLPINDYYDENNDDYISLTGWKSLSDFILQAKDNNENDLLIYNAKQSVKKDKKKFPHEENSFLIEQFNYPNICQFTKLFLEYSADDIFYTAIVGIDVLSRGELESVKERSLMKYNSYIQYNKEYDNVRLVRDTYYVREHFTMLIQAQFSNENETYQILSYYKKFKSFVTSIDKCMQLFKKIIPDFDDEDILRIKNRYDEIVDIMKNKDYKHIGNIKKAAILSYVNGVKKNPVFVSKIIEEIAEETEKNNHGNNNNIVEQKEEQNIENVNTNKKKRKRKSRRKKKNRFIYTPGESSS